MQIPIDLDRGSGTPLATQLAEQLGQAIRLGRIPAGARLPSSRTLSEQLQIGRNTVVRAYETLTIEGLAESRVASGFFATPDLAEATVQSVFAKAEPRPRQDAAPPLVALVAARAPQRLNARRDRNFCDFVPGRPDPELFPVKIWRRLLQGRLAYGGAVGMSEHGDPAGLPALRALIAEHVSMSRGVIAAPDQVFVTGGIQEGLSLMARLLLSPSSTVVTEDPCHQGAAFAFEQAGARLAPVSVDEDGLVTARLPEGGATLCYVTPAHQFPTGYALSPARRASLISWARRSGCYIFEDDYDSEYQYDGSPLQALAGTAPDCTIYAGTFSTTLGAGLRLGYLIVPPELVEPVRAAKILLNAGNSWLDQATLAEFMRAGCYRAHLTRSRAQYKESRDALLASLRRYFGKVEVSGELTGLHVFWRLPAGVPEAERLEELARGHRVGVYSLASAGAREIQPSALTRRSLLLGYAGLLPQQIDQGIARLSDAVDDTLDTQHDFLSELLLDDPPPSRQRPGQPRRKANRSQLQRPSALRTVAPARAYTLNDNPRREAAVPIVRGIFRYPIKGLSPQPVRGIELVEGKPFPFDRVFALARPGVPIDVNEPSWAKKGLFLMLMLDDALARVRSHVDPETLRLTVTRPDPSHPDDPARGACALDVDLGTQAGRDEVAAFFLEQVPGLPAAPKLVRSREGHFMDKPDNVMSCINLATVRSIEQQLGYPINPLRFRANFYIDGARPWEEFEWIGSDIRLGDVLCRVDRRNGRCGAVNVNPVTGARDLDLPRAFREAFGHKDLGVYLIARKSGKVVVGDDVTIPQLAGATNQSGSSASSVSSWRPPSGPGSYICRGCYYLYDEAKGAPGLAAGTAFSAIRADWRCPDCGTERANFRPYVPGVAE
jgi:GntR family transcriptional regulator / MocR family aminotransferase